MKSKYIVVIALALAAVLTVMALTLQTTRNNLQTFSGETMGTRYTVHITECNLHDCDAAALAVRRRLRTLVGQLSHYEPDSDVSRFNRSRDTAWIPVPVELLKIVRYALDISAISGGAFDITVAPAVDAWGFGAAEARDAPAQENIAAAAAAIGFRRLAIRERPPALRKTDPDLRIDLSAIAKGYAVDDIALLLEDRGILNYLIEIGGEIRSAGTKPLRRPWRVGIESPDGDTDKLIVVTPGDAAVATSGDYRNFFVADGQRRQHTIDPSTAEPVKHNLASVSVIMPSAMEADTFATLLMVLGPERGYDYAAQRGIPALFIVREELGLAMVSTPEFRRYLPGNQPR